MSTLHR